MAPSVSSVRRHWLLLVAPWIGATMSANQAHRFLSRPLVHAIRAGCALVAAGQLMGVSVAAMPRPDAAVAERRAS